MHSKLRNALLGSGLITAALMAIPALAADGNLVQLTIHTQESMPGVSQMPPQTITRKVCMSAKRFDTEQLLKTGMHSECKLTNYKSAGKLITFDVVCDKPVTVTSHGEFHLTDAANFSGRVHSDVNVEGHAMSVDASYTGERVGSCDYTPPQA